MASLTRSRRRSCRSGWPVQTAWTPLASFSCESAIDLEGVATPESPRPCRFCGRFSACLDRDLGSVFSTLLMRRFLPAWPRRKRAWRGRSGDGFWRKISGVMDRLDLGIESLGKTVKDAELDSLLHEGIGSRHYFKLTRNIFGSEGGATVSGLSLAKGAFS